MNNKTKLKPRDLWAPMTYWNEREYLRDKDLRLKKERKGKIK